MGLTLVVLAAGMGSRYGGLKQIDPVGPSGEFVIDYSIYDAVRAGFDRVVCVIRRDIEADFRQAVGAHFERHVEVEYVFQDMQDLPAAFTVPADRAKPWGTGQAILACREAVRTPFAAINADDFYGADAYRRLAAFLKTQANASTQFAMVAFRLANTLSEHGHVSRGLCKVTANDLLESVTEVTRIERIPDGIRHNGEGPGFRGDEAVSMNMWGFTPAVFGFLTELFTEFLRTKGTDPKAEFYIPTAIDTLIRQARASVRVLTTPDHWFGVTYTQDKPGVVAAIRERVTRGEYPARLWPK